VAEEVLEARSFVEAARARNLLASPAIWIRTLQEAFQEIRHERQRCRFFAVLLFNGMPPDIRIILETVLDEMIIPPVDSDPAASRPARLQRALNRIEYSLSTTFNSTCTAIGLEQPARYSFAEVDAEEQRAAEAEENAVVPAEGEYVGDETRPVGRRNDYYHRILETNVARMSLEQLDVFESIMEALRAVHADPVGANIGRYFMLEGPGGVGKTLILETIIAACIVEGLSVMPTASTGIAANLLPRGQTLHSALLIPKGVAADDRPRLEGHTQIAARLRGLALLISDEVSMLHRDVLAYAELTLRELWPRDHPRRQLPFGGTPIVLSGNWAQLKPVVRRGDDAASRAASVKMMPLFTDNFHEFLLRVNQRVGPGQERHAEWLDKLGRGQNYADAAFKHVLIPAENRCDTGEELIDFVFPRALLADAIANIEHLRTGAILASHRETVLRMNQHVADRMPAEWKDLNGYDHLRPGGERPAAWDVNAADADVENLHQRMPSGFPPYALKLKVGAICVMLCNYDSRAGLFNGTRIQILGFVGDNLIRVRILDGRGVHVGQTRLIGRGRFEYGRDPGERGIPFRREQFPLDLAMFMTYNKGQGQTYQRTGLWNYDAQPFADGMFYTGCSRSTSAAGLKIFSSLGEYNTNKVDFELLGVRPRMADDPPPPPVQPPTDPAPPQTPIARFPRVEPMDLTRTPLPLLSEEQMDDLPPPPTPQTVGSVMDWEFPEVPPLPTDGDPSEPTQETGAEQAPPPKPEPGATAPPAETPPNRGPSLYRRL
jgi:hypothetical protein